MALFSLNDFEDDDIEDFEGWDALEIQEDPDADDMTWLFPTKGPGQFRDLNKKKKNKTKTKKKRKPSSVE